MVLAMNVTFDMIEQTGRCLIWERFEGAGESIKTSAHVGWTRCTVVIHLMLDLN